MTNAISRLHRSLEVWSFKYNCYEAVHPWTPFCSDCALGIGVTVFGEAIKLYTPLYLFSQIVRRKYDYDSFVNTGQSILRSTTFISLNAFFALLFFCSSQYLTGKFYYYAVAYIPGFLASAMAVMVEKPNRRASLAFYVANVASEALFRIYVAGGYVRPINNGQVYLFTVSMATLMMLAKKQGFDDDPLSAAIKLVVGPEEALRKRKRRRQETQIESSNRLSEISEVQEELFHEALNDDHDANEQKESLRTMQYAIDRSQSDSSSSSSSSGGIQSSRHDNSDNLMLRKLKTAFNWCKFLLTTRHRLCPHQTDCSCAYYVARSSARALAIGYVAQLGLRLSSRLPKLWSQPDSIWDLPKILIDPGILKFGLFLSTFSGLFKATNCALRWSSDTSKPMHSFIASLVAGPALFFYPSPTVALYVLWKCLEALFNEAVKHEVIKNRDMWIVVLYGLATSQLFYSALMNPRYMKKSYMAFLDRISHHKMHMINRSVLDVFGTNASWGYEDFFPDLHPKFMSRAFLGSVWIWMIEHKIQTKQCYL